MNTKSDKERNVIHLQLKEANLRSQKGEHHYFGSLASIFDCFSPEQLGITYGSLRNAFSKMESPLTFENARCIIRKGVLLTKKGNRGRKQEATQIPN